MPDIGQPPSCRPKSAVPGTRLDLLRLDMAVGAAGQRPAAQPFGHVLAVLEDQDDQHAGHYEADHLEQRFVGAAGQAQHIGGFRDEEPVDGGICQPSNPDIAVMGRFVADRQHSQIARDREPECPW